MTWATSTRKTRLPANWSSIRRAVLERDGYQCRIRGPRCAVAATDADHIRAGDDHRLENLQAACKPCHAAKSSAEGHAARPKRARDPEPHPGLIGG